jgi:hypothetical protein
MEEGTFRLYRTKGLGGQSFDDVGFQPRGGEERIVMRTLRSKLELHRIPWPIAVPVEGGTYRMGVSEARALHAANRFRRVTCWELQPESESNLLFDLRLMQWGGLLLSLPLLLAWRWRRTRRPEEQWPGRVVTGEP